MLSNKIYILIFTLILMSGCRPASPLSMEDIRNAVYDLPDIGKVRFENGEYNRAANESLRKSYLHIGLVDLFAFGDLNDDGSEDAVTFLSRNVGGPEIFLSLEVFINDDGKPSHATSYVIGDRVGIDSVKITQGTIDLSIITQGPGDAKCCPTLHVSKRLHLQNRELVEYNNP